MQRDSPQVRFVLETAPTHRLNNGSNTMIDHFPRSDGDPNHRPSPEMLNPNNDDNRVNFYQRADEATVKHWREVIGTDLARAFGYLQHRGQKWYLRSFPKGYELFTRFRKNQVQDHYLFGRGGPSSSKGGVQARGLAYESPQEFCGHARWLWQDVTLDHKNCPCTRCSGVKSQKQINKLLNIRSLVPDEAPSTGRARNHLPSGMAPNVLLYRSGSSSHQEQPARTAPQRPPDHIASAVLMSDLATGRTYRAGELVWLLLPSPIEFPAGEEPLSIGYWPVVVVETPGHGQGATSTPYRISALALSIELQASQDQILPYHTFSPPVDLLLIMIDVAVHAERIPDLSRVENFSFVPASSQLQNPDPRWTEYWYQDCAMAFVIAVATSEMLASSFSSTDPWEFVSIPSDSRPSITQQRYQGLWYGPERIWTGDIIRLTMPRYLLPHYIRGISPNAEMRSLLLKLEAIYVQPRDESDDSAASIMVSGTIYEVSDEAFSESAAANDRPPEHFEVVGLPLVDVTSLPLPPPPAGLKFRNITPGPEFVVDFDVQTIAGRYYPGLVQDIPPNFVETLPPERVEAMSLQAPGFFAASNAVHPAGDRAELLKKATLSALKELQRQWKQQNGQADENDDLFGDIDDDDDNDLDGDAMEASQSAGPS